MASNSINPCYSLTDHERPARSPFLQGTFYDECTSRSTSRRAQHRTTTWMICCLASAAVLGASLWGSWRPSSSSISPNEWRAMDNVGVPSSPLDVDYKAYEDTEDRGTERLLQFFPGPTTSPSEWPSFSPVGSTTVAPTISPTIDEPGPTISHSPSVSQRPSVSMTPSLSLAPSTQPSGMPSLSAAPSALPSGVPSLPAAPSGLPSGMPEALSLSAAPSGLPSGMPEALSLSAAPSGLPSGMPEAPLAPPSSISSEPTISPISRTVNEVVLTGMPSNGPTAKPTPPQTKAPSRDPTPEPTKAPSREPTPEPTVAPTVVPTTMPTSAPTKEPTEAPTKEPTKRPTTSTPTISPTVFGIRQPLLCNETMAYYYVFFEQFDLTLLSPGLLDDGLVTSYNTITNTSLCHPMVTTAQVMDQGLQLQEMPVTSMNLVNISAFPWAVEALEANQLVTVQRMKFLVQSRQLDVNASLFDSELIRMQFIATYNDYLTVMMGASFAALAVRDAPGPSEAPSNMPSFEPSIAPSMTSSFEPSMAPTLSPTKLETPVPTAGPTLPPTLSPTPLPTAAPTSSPTPVPTPVLSAAPTPLPTNEPTPLPTNVPSPEPTPNPSRRPTRRPVRDPTRRPTSRPTMRPTTEDSPTNRRTRNPSGGSSIGTFSPTTSPTSIPTQRPTKRPSQRPTVVSETTRTEPPVDGPSARPTAKPTARLTDAPTGRPISEPNTREPTTSPVQSLIQAPTYPPVSTTQDAPTILTEVPTLASADAPSLVSSPTTSDPPAQDLSSVTLKPSVLDSVSSPDLDQVQEATTEPVLDVEGNSAPTSTPEAMLRTPELRGVRMIVSGVDVLPETSLPIWEVTTEEFIAEEIKSILPEVEVVEVAVLYISQNRQSAPRELQNVPTVSDAPPSNLTTTIDFDVEFTLQSVVEGHNVRRYVGAAFDATSEKGAYMQTLKSSGDPAFAGLYDVLVVLPEVASPSAAQEGAQVESNTGMVIGIVAVCIACVAFLIIGVFVWARRGPGLSVGSSGQMLNMDNESEIMVNVGQMSAMEQDVSTLGDPIPQGMGTAHIDGSLAEETQSLPYDYKAAAALLPPQEENDRYSFSDISSNITEVQTDDDTFNAQYKRPYEDILDERLEVEAPPGMLGMVLEEDAEGIATVYDMKDKSPLADQVRLGDKLVAVDGLDITGMPASAASKLIAQKRDLKRILTFRRPVTTMRGGQVAALQ